MPVSQGSDNLQERLPRCASCDNAFELPPRSLDGADDAVDLSFSHVPKILSGCLHTICQSCAEEALQRSSVSSTIHCPLCEVATIDVLSTSDLTSNIIKMQDVRRWSTTCDACDDDVDASHYCVHCAIVICPFHVKSHTRSRATKAHKLTTLNSQSGTAGEPREAHRLPVYCPKHPGVRAKLFCSEPCGTLSCHDCGVAHHSGHTVSLSRSEEVEVMYRAGLTRRMVKLRNRVAKVQGAAEDVGATKSGAELSACMAEKAARQAFAKLRRAVDSRERSVLKNIRGARTAKDHDLDSQLETLEQTRRAYNLALHVTGECLDALGGEQLLAMERDLSKCLDKHDADFASLALEPCVDGSVEFAYDRSIFKALVAGISKVGCLPSNDVDRGDDLYEVQTAAEEDSNPAHRDVHFTLSAVTEDTKGVNSVTSDETVVVEVRNGSEQDFLERGIEGPMVGRVILHTKLKGAKHFAYDAEHFLESLSQRMLSEYEQPKPDNSIPTIRFSKTLRVRVLGRRIG